MEYRLARRERIKVEQLPTVVVEAKSCSFQKIAKQEEFQFQHRFL